MVRYIEVMPVGVFRDVIETKIGTAKLMLVYVTQSCIVFFYCAYSVAMHL